MKLVLLSFIFGLGLSACNSGINYKFSPPAPEEPVGSSKNPTPEPSPIVIPTATPEVPGTPLPMPGSTVTPTPTSTSTPTVPPTATPTVSPAPSPTPVSSPTPIEEVVDAPTVLGILDILFVVDNSPSMKEDQAKLATKFPKFTDELKDLDWQIGITTTDTTKKGVDGTLLPYADDKFNLTNNFVLRPGMLPSQASFENTIMRKEVGSGFEMPIKASLHALQKRADYPNNSFFRNGSNFSIIIISDEDEDSTGRNAEGDGTGHEPWTTENEPQNLVNYVSGLNFSSFSVSTISIIPNDKKCKSSHGNGHYSNVYKELVLLTKGFMGSICDKDFTGTLKSIAQTIKAPITTITLSREPVPGSVKVELDPLDPAATYTVNGSKIIFNKTLSRGTKIKVTYLPK